MNKKFGLGILSALAVGQFVPNGSQAAEGEHELDLKARAVYWKEESVAVPTASAPHPEPTEFEQSALGLLDLKPSGGPAAPAWMTFYCTNATPKGN